MDDLDDLVGILFVNDIFRTGRPRPNGDGGSREREYSGCQQERGVVRDRIDQETDGDRPGHRADIASHLVRRHHGSASPALA